MIPSFHVLAFELHQMTIVGQHISSGDEVRYDLFIRSDPSLTRCSASTFVTLSSAVQTRSTLLCSDAEASVGTVDEPSLCVSF